jgi:predicted MFS family arabinose efflux permease
VRAGPRALAPLRHRRYRLLVSGQVTSGVGDAAYAVALPWFILATHGGTVLLGTVLAAYGIPRTALILAGGWASDRWRPQAVMLATDAARAVAVTVLAVMAAAGPARAALLIPVAAVLGAGEGLFLPASFSIVPSLLPGEDLQAGNALASGGTQLAALAGPAAGGLLVALGSPAAAFGLDAVSFAVSAATLLALLPARRRVPAAAAPAASAAAAGATPVAPAAEADPPGPAPSLRYLLRTERVLLVVMVINVAANLGSAGLDGVALPALAHGPLHASAQGYGAILAGFAAGAVLGTLAAGQAGNPRRPAVTGSLAFLAEAVFIAVTPFLGHLGPVVAAQALFGACNGFGNTCTVTAFQRWAPRGSLGRLNGVLLVTSFGVAPVSVLLAAWSGRALGPSAFFLFAAVTIALAVGGGLTQRRWRDFGRAQGPQARAPQAGAAPVGAPAASDPAAGDAVATVPASAAGS